MSPELYIGLDLGGTNIKGVLIDPSAHVIASADTATEREGGGAHVVARMTGLARQLLDKADTPLDRVVGVGVGAPGFLHHEKGLMLQPVNFPGWRDFPIRDLLGEALGKPVVLEKDSNAAAWGEFQAGAGRGSRDMALLTLGTGIGGGIIVNGQLLRGHTDVGAELGHVPVVQGGRRCGCGNLGCLEAYACATATVARFTEAVRGGAESSLAERVLAGAQITAKQICEHARAADALSLEILEETGRFLGVGVYTIIVTVNPECVVLGGGMIAAGELIMDAVRAEVARRVIPRVRENTRIVFAELGNLAGAIGAAGCAVTAVKARSENPSATPPPE